MELQALSSSHRNTLTMMEVKLTVPLVVLHDLKHTQSKNPQLWFQQQKHLNSNTWGIQLQQQMQRGASRFSDEIFVLKGKVSKQTEFVKFWFCYKHWSFTKTILLSIHFCEALW